MARKPILGVDIDGTLANTMDIFLKKIEIDYKITVSKEQITDYNMQNFIPLTKEQITSTWEKAWDEHERIELEDKDAPGVLKLLKSKFEIHIVTATNAKHEHLEAWLSKKEIPYDKIQRFERQLNKANSNVDIHIDDCFEVIDPFVKNNTKMILIEQPWNLKHHKILKDEKMVNVVKGWKQIEGLLNKN